MYFFQSNSYKDQTSPKIMLDFSGKKHVNVGR